MQRRPRLSAEGAALSIFAFRVTREQTEVVTQAGTRQAGRHADETGGRVPPYRGGKKIKFLNFTGSGA